MLICLFVRFVLFVFDITWGEKYQWIKTWGKMDNDIFFIVFVYWCFIVFKTTQKLRKSLICNVKKLRKFCFTLILLFVIHFFLEHGSGGLNGWYCLPDSSSLLGINPETSSRVTLASLGIAFQATLVGLLSYRYELWIISKRHAVSASACPIGASVCCFSLDDGAFSA